MTIIENLNAASNKTDAAIAKLDDPLRSIAQSHIDSARASWIRQQRLPPVPDDAIPMIAYEVKFTSDVEEWLGARDRALALRPETDRAIAALPARMTKVKDSLSSQIAQVRRKVVTSPSVYYVQRRAEQEVTVRAQLAQATPSLRRTLYAVMRQDRWLRRD